ncbi:zinc-binding alcohol dehydrogenase family protein [Oceanimonas sp. MB9]|uniref:zinc-binding alcohol dehydrogenase family protein n=1 Tax=Oceanimonas sp. MB9 TaxID=2588453 RepID=UPI0013F624C7|nr:zinc-binding alcohol dehydrogenase family protein [Oceanimonas sp. MB9]NHI00215.1 Zinc-type alcohol dehydrogenase-like protein [Oceanimonas sp. MB9]
MKAIGYQHPAPISEASALVDIELPQPVATGRDLLVKVHAIAVNPVDYKVRQRAAAEPGQYKVLGWDAVGEVVATGAEVSLFQPGDRVYYAGDLTRPGSDAEYQLVDERLVGHKPSSLSDAEAAALPLTSITAWELLFEHLQLARTEPNGGQTSNEVLLVVGAAGGVGSILLQLARVLTGATIIATASREASRHWVNELGADYVVDHRQPLKPQIDALIAQHNLGPVTHIASLNATEDYFETYVDLLAPFGRIGMIDDPDTLDVMKLKPKSLSLHIEFMFARSMHQARDMGAQHELLQQVAQLIDQGHIRTTLGKQLGVINAANLRAAHAELESGRAVGKLVLEGFEP